MVDKMSGVVTRKELLARVRRCSPRARKTVLRVIEGKVSQDGAAFIKETFDLLEPDGTARSIDFFSARTCDCGHLLGETKLVAVCEACGRYTCSAPGCSFTCMACGGAFCRRDVSVYADGEAYCWKCRPKKWAKSVFELTKKGVKRAFGR